jgi:hypothetical protein
MSNDYGVVQITDESGKVTSYPAYGCGHCSDPVVLNPARKRERLTCTDCGKWICEQKELCQVGCTPIYALADDHLEASSRWTKYIPALMAGLKTVDEARGAGLLQE